MVGFLMRYEFIEVNVIYDNRISDPGLKASNNTYVPPSSVQKAGYEKHSLKIT